MSLIYLSGLSIASKGILEENEPPPKNDVPSILPR